ncbi:MAG: GMC family oxidoreductase [Cyclobacteriaceae bacterium]|nr:GMC family oxidoreductase [Cyclobacteriaceae bacterium]
MAFNINGKAADANTYDVIVVGSGMSGGWAAKEFSENGFKTLVLERGRNVEHGKDYPTAMKEPWEFDHRLEIDPRDKAENPIINRCYAYNEATEHFFVKDKEHPYIQNKPFDWIRGYQVGGKSLLWARWTQRWSVMDFESNARDGYGVEWPIGYEDMAPWYSYVEKFVGISGNRDGLAQVPDGEYLPPMDMTCVEKHLKNNIESTYSNRNLIISRTANLSQAHMGRGPCMYRDRCNRGCPFGGYFSSNSATLPAAMATGNMTLRPNSVVHSVIYDDQAQKATGVRVIDAQTKEMTEYYARVIFLNAGTLNTTLIMLNSTSSRFPQGLGNEYDILGRYLMDHNYRGRISAEFDGFKDQYYFGKRPTGVYIPRFRNVGSDKQTDFLRGYAFSAGTGRGTGGDMSGLTDPFGADYKEKMFELGSWNIGMTGMGEHLPYHDNRVTLNKDKTDEWGMPQLEIDCEYKENEVNMLRDMLESGAEMLDNAGFKNIRTTDTGQAPGLGIHEMGTARMGKDVKTSILNKFNQIHAVPNVFVTDGAAMTSSACQNPSITYMALTARAANYAIEELKKQNL